jgi:hypothetical protein
MQNEHSERAITEARDLIQDLRTIDSQDSLENLFRAAGPELGAASSGSDEKRCQMPSSMLMRHRSKLRSTTANGFSVCAFLMMEWASRERF